MTALDRMFARQKQERLDQRLEADRLQEAEMRARERAQLAATEKRIAPFVARIRATVPDDLRAHLAGAKANLDKYQGALDKARAELASHAESEIDLADLVDWQLRKMALEQSIPRLERAAKEAHGPYNAALQAVSFVMERELSVLRQELATRRDEEMKRHQACLQQFDRESSDLTFIHSYCVVSGRLE